VILEKKLIQDIFNNTNTDEPSSIRDGNKNNNNYTGEPNSIDILTQTSTSSWCQCKKKQILWNFLTSRLETTSRQNTEAEKYSIYAGLRLGSIATIYSTNYKGTTGASRKNLGFRFIF
jgi:hypothetical protein